MLALEVTNMQTGVWKRQDGRWCESRTEWGQNEHCQSGKFVRKWCLLNPPAIEDHTDERYCGITGNVLVVRLNNAVFSYIRSSYVSPIIDVARTVFTKAKFA